MSGISWAICKSATRSRQNGKTNVDFTEARDSEWQWHLLGHMQDCISLQTDNHASTPPLSFLQAGCPSWRPTNSVKALKAMGKYLVAVEVGCVIGQQLMQVKTMGSDVLSTHCRPANQPQALIFTSSHSVSSQSVGWLAFNGTCNTN